MRQKPFRRVLPIAFALLLTALPAIADLENVTVGGQIRVRGNYWMNSFNSGATPTLVGYELRWPAATMVGRPIGSFLGGQSVVSHFDWDSYGHDYKLVEQRTNLHVRADFTQDVAAFIELDNFDVWGEDFRSNHITGMDARGVTADDVEIYQAFIEADNMFGVPLRLRVGRQELVLGGGWLVGNNTAMPEFTGLSFDGIRATYTHDLFAVDAFWTKLAETSPLEEDGDTDFSGIYASYVGIENINIDAYWFWLRDAAALKDTNGTWLAEWLEDLLGYDDYDVTNLHTVGLRVAGTAGAFDFAANAAFQFGNASRIGFLFRPYTYGDDGADFDSWAADVDLGYTFDVKYQPRVHIGAAYFDGEDNRDITFWEWLNPFAELVRPQSSISFNRLFSNTVYSYFIDEMGELSNFWTVRGGVDVHPCESTEAGLDIAYLGVVDTFDQPVHLRFGRFRLAIASALSFWTDEAASDIGWQTDLWLKYHYSEDLSFEVGWSHLFTGDALKDGNFNDMNGLLINAGTGDSDADYVYFETVARF